MKTAKSKATQKRYKSSPKRPGRVRKALLTTVLVLVFCLICTGGFFIIYTLRGGTIANPLQPYFVAREFPGHTSAVNNVRAQSFAENLCVVSEDVPLDGVTLDTEQEGLLLDIDNQSVMFSKGAYQRVYPASITKIMTAMLALKYGNMDDTVTITQENVTLEAGSQVCGFVAEDRVTMNKLLHGLLVFSGNDAASAIATHISGSEAEFVNLMNSYAAQLGCTGTHFTNPHGLQNEDHYTTPYDIYLMLKEALNYPEFTEITQMPSYTLTYQHADGTTVNTILEATDQYLTGESHAPKDVTVLGGKTGTTSTAGNCLAILSQNSYGKPFVSIVMGAQSKPELYQQMNSLLQNINS